MRRALRILAVGVMVALALGLLLIWSLYLAARREPTFYRQALAAAPSQQQLAGDQLEREVVELHNQLQDPGQWSATFTEEQINGWLASDLPEKFPQLLPSEISQPRVALADEQLLVACRYRSSKLAGVLSLTAQVSLLEDQRNVLAVRIKAVRLGSLPLPMNVLLNRISEMASRREFHIEWIQLDGEPVALIRLPLDDVQGLKENVTLEALSTSPGKVSVSGSSRPS